MRVHERLDRCLAADVPRTLEVVVAARDDLWARALDVHVVWRVERAVKGRAGAGLAKERGRILEWVAHVNRRRVAAEGRVHTVELLCQVDRRPHLRREGAAEQREWVGQGLGSACPRRREVGRGPRPASEDALDEAA